MRTRTAIRALKAAGVLRPKPPQDDSQPQNRFAYWVAAHVLLPNGRIEMVTDEFTIGRPIDRGSDLKQLEALIARGFRMQAGAVPLVGAPIRVHVISFTPLRAFYQPEPPAEPPSDQEGA
jgi:hypothetical protein